MARREYGYTYEGTSIFEIIKENAPHPDDSPLPEDRYVFVMGPYTAFDAEYAFDDADELESPFIDDPLFDEDKHVDDDGHGRMDWALQDLCARLREKFGVTAFIASDIGVPTEEEAGPGQEAKSVLDQSVEFAAVSDAVMFIFTQAGLTTGVGAEAGAIPGEFNLRHDNPEPMRKPRERFRIFCGPEFRSASVEEIPSTYGIDAIEFDDESELISNTQQFLANLERDDPDRHLPVFNQYEG